jgi:hypothetical protein
MPLSFAEAMPVHVLTKDNWRMTDTTRFVAQVQYPSAASVGAVALRLACKVYIAVDDMNADDLQKTARIDFQIPFS